MKAKVLIERLELHAYHGWHPHEGEFGQPYAIDVELLTDVGRAASTDHLSDALDYDAIVTTTKGIFTGRRHKLVESAGVELARGLMARFPAVDEVCVRVRKLTPPIPERIGAVGVELRLTRDEFARDA
jgi:dihydroneopterin aldolase